jgi:hypothetical protein
MREEDIAGEGALAEPPPGTLAALLTASLSAQLADAVSEFVGAAYTARIVRIEPHAHGGADILVAFVPRPPDHTLKIALGDDTIELPLPPGVVDEPTS